MATIENWHFGCWVVPPRWKGTPYARRRGFFEEHPGHCQYHFPCPACGYPTLGQRASYEICRLCWWEDDGQDDPYADECMGGPNGNLTLDQARENFEITGCIWADAEQSDLLPKDAARVFDPRILSAKMRLRRAYEALMALRPGLGVHAQWEEIDVLCRALGEVEWQIEQERERGMKRKTPKRRR